MLLESMKSNWNMYVERGQKMILDFVESLENADIW